MKNNSKKKPIDSLKNLWSHLSLNRKRQFFLLLILMLASAFAEVISLGAVIPFLGIITSPERVMEQRAVSWLVQLIRINSKHDIVLILTMAFILAALIAGVLRTILLWSSTKLAFLTGTDLGIKVYSNTLNQPYGRLVARNSSEVISAVTNKIDAVVFSVLFPILTIISSAIIFSTIMIALIMINPVMAIGAITVFGLSYGLVTIIFNRRLRNNSHNIARAQAQVIKSLQEGLGGIRDIILDGTQPNFRDIYHRSDRILRMAQANNSFISGVPRFLMETMGVIFIAILAYGFSVQEDGVESALPTLGVLALAAQRLLPILQQSYYSWTSVVGNHASLADTIYLLQESSTSTIFPPTSATPLTLKDSIELKELGFRYTDSGPRILKGINFVVRKGARIGIIGRTGSGKSTLVDILMGLLQPTEGALLIDGVDVKRELLASWQRNISHVPQNIFLSDSTLAENIAFGVHPNCIDMERVRCAARKAQIADFIESSPDGYSALVGERGIHLSGGQIQRIGIARAFYKQANVLVFDESTSAVDNETENSIMRAVEQLGKDATIFIIAHRVTTLGLCDTIIELENGLIKAVGDYDTVIEKISKFPEIIS